MSNPLGVAIQNLVRRLSEWKRTTKSIVIVVLFFIIVIATPLIVYFVLRINSDLRSRATLEEPQRVIVGNVALDSFTVAWTTPSEKQIGYLVWGTDQSNVNTVAIDARDRADNSSRFTHIVTLRNLQPDTTYYYKIVSGASRFPAETPFSFKTPAVPAQGTPNVVSVFGEVVSGTTDSLVYIIPANGTTSLFPLITVVTDDLTWFHNAASFYKKDLSGSQTVTVSEVMHIVADTGEKAARKDVPSSQSPVSLSLDIATNDIDDLPLFANTAITPTITQTTAPTPTSTTPVVNVTLRPSATPGDDDEDDETTPPKKNLLSSIIDFFKLKQEVNLDDIAIEDLVSKDGLIAALRLQGIVTNVTENSFSIVWNTIQKEEGKVSFGESMQAMTQTRDDERKETFDASWGYFHQVTLRNLTPEKSYFYKRNTHGLSEQFATPKTLGSPPQFSNISGELSNAKGECFIRGYLKRGNDLSTSQSVIVIKSPYTWNMNAGTMRKADMSAYFSPVASDIAVFEARCLSDDRTFSIGKTEKPFGEITDETTITIQMQ
ncbi:MAG: fibronectin type III domain-containing protein [Candidatus Dojkabacteria bacterium]|nr:MAG: fibronectin type III domain-containing protein [Candidatus Dojkabacteria bacterium]